ncbi:CBS domain-containing protein [Pseudonocardia acaciae]|uniref:CBS domain-containing protein n=1 Tax=Pseudonocardia acaciae TaxID=551276 RepID=UPI00048E779D|nr:CBS domain-containing protein [Pseudonocardia acaciae]
MTVDYPRLAAPPETLDDDPRLAELMSRRLVGITSDTAMRVALGLLADMGVRHLPVFAGRRCVGLLFEHDIIRCLVGGASGGADAAGEMCRRVPVLRPTDRRSTAVDRMAGGGVDAVLVAEGHRLVGLVTASDVIRSLGTAQMVAPEA